MTKKIFTDCVQRLIKTFNEIDLTDQSVYMNWLAQTYYYTSHSEQLLNTFANDSQNLDIKNRWLSHANEESGHENLALSDLKRLGGNIEDYPELQITKDLYEKQVGISKRSSGIAPFGWALALEGLAAYVNDDYIEAISKAHGKKATRFIRVHAEEDEDHIEKALDMVSMIGDNKEIEDNIKLTSDIYCQLLMTCYKIGKSYKNVA